MPPAPRDAVGVALVEDDRALRETLRRGLREDGFVVWAAATGTEFLSMLDDHAPDVLVIDVGLHDSDGRDVCMAARARGVDAPALFLTARGATQDQLSAFAAGGDDYVVKPFVFAALVARLNALARRHRRPLEVNDRWTLDPATLLLSAESGDLALTPTEFRVLAALAGAGGRIVRRSDLARAGWPGGGSVADNTLDSFVARLRRKLRHAARGEEDPTITTVHGVGYRLS